MLIIVGYIIVMIGTLGGFMMAGGNPMALLHLSEFVVIGGISIGVMVVAAPMSVLKRVASDIQHALKGGEVGEEDYMELMKLLYEIFMVGRRNGLIALDEHVTDPEASSIFSKYATFVNDKHRCEFLVGALRPIIDGKIKPDQLQDLLDSEIHTMEEESHQPVEILHLLSDSLPAIGIVAAVLGIINTMAAISEGPEKVGQKVAAALTGTFLGILAAYGFVGPLGMKVHSMHAGEINYYKIMSKAISGFAKGLAPIMAVEIARRSLEGSVKPTADDLEQTLKAIGSGG